MNSHVHRAKSGKVWSTGPSVPPTWGMPPSQHMDVFANPEAL